MKTTLTKRKQGRPAAMIVAAEFELPSQRAAEKATAQTAVALVE